VGAAASIFALVASLLIRVGAPAPDVALPMAGGSVQRVAAEKGRFVVMHFWATWCHVCIEELPVFTRLERAYGSKIRLLTVSDEREDVAASYYRLWNVDLPLVAGTKGSVFAAYGVVALPVTVVIAPDGTVRYVREGEVDEGALKQALN